MDPQALLQIKQQQEILNQYQSQFYDFLSKFQQTLDTQSQPYDYSNRSRYESFTENKAQDFYTNNVFSYRKAVEQMLTNEKTSLNVDFGHLQQYDTDLAAVIEQNYLRVDQVLKGALVELIKEIDANALTTAENEPKLFYVGFLNFKVIDKLRDLDTGKCGKLVAFNGTVLRTSEVKPELLIGTFRCLECSTPVSGVHQQYKYTTPSICSNPTCGNKNRWSLIREESQFVDWQRVKVQENNDEVPAGSLPRTLEVILRDDTVEKVRAGDKIVFTGTVIVVPDVAAISAPGQRTVSVKGSKKGKGGINSQEGEGVKGIKGTGVRELTHRLAFLANAVQTVDQSLGRVNIRSEDDLDPSEVLHLFTQAQQDKIEEMIRDSNLYQNLLRSIAPNVYGHDDIKRAILLMLLGGVHKKTSEGINLRGDINVIIVGDPASAKSQLLKFVSNFLPRAVYTSGKASSAAGLTANVAREPESGEFCIEAGALMLADNGVCCIDEFDKMEVKDQVAIHEAMEQQTITIAKAGIHATMNSRTSILAAANPIGGRYDKSKGIKQNVYLPPAILSRFDLLHVMVDEQDDDADKNIAQHILNLHTAKYDVIKAPYSITDMQRYIKYARSIKPEFEIPAKMYLVDQYKQLRTQDAVPGSNNSYRITVRQLEALVRLSEAHARMRCSMIVEIVDVKEASRLIKNSIVTIESPDIEIDAEVDLQQDAQIAQSIAKNILQPSRVMQNQERNNDMERDGEDAGQKDGDGMDIDSQEQGDKSIMMDPKASEHRRQKRTQTESQQGSQGTKRVRASQEAEVEQQRSQRSQGAGSQHQQQTSQQQQQVEKIRIKIKASKLADIKDVLVAIFKQNEDLAKTADDDEIEETEGRLLDLGSSQIFVMQQQHLLQKYFDVMIVQRQVISSEEQIQEEIDLVNSAIQYFIKQDNSIVQVSSPDPIDDETPDDYKRRMMNERDLALNANYNFI